jgi:hypothetical protein
MWVLGNVRCDGLNVGPGAGHGGSLNWAETRSGCTSSIARAGDPGLMAAVQGSDGTVVAWTGESDADDCR